MRKGLKRPVSILLAVAMIMSIFTILPVATVNAEETDDPWIFATNDDKSYPELADKYYRYNNVTAPFGSGGSFEVNATSLKLCDKTVASISTSISGTKRVYADTVYVTGTGTESDPFEFYPNYIYGSASATKFSTSTWQVSNANPGDGFTSIVRINVGSSYVQFKTQGTHSQGSSNYIGVGTTKYGYAYSGTDASAKSGIGPFSLPESGNIYYLGTALYNSATEYVFDETRPLRDSFGESTTPPATSYTVTWKDWDGTPLGTNTFAEGETPAYSGTPTRPDSEDNTYSFSGWDPEPAPLYDDAEYTAQYTQTRLYTVIWANYDNNPIKTEKYAEGASPVYNGADPVRPETDEYVYTFIGWSPSLTDVSADITYTAQYSSKHKYTVTWNNWDDTELYSETLLEGDDPSYNGETPTKPYDGTNLYSFIGWSPEIETVSGDATYTAQFSAAAISFDGFFLRTDDTSKSYDLVGKWYRYNDSDPAQFEEVGPFDDSGSPIQLCGKDVADIDPPDANAAFAHSVYVTGEGTEDDPYVFTANYLFSKHNGALNASGSATLSFVSSSYTEPKPGDSFQYYTRIGIGSNQALFLQHTDEGPMNATSSGNYVGLGKNGSYGPKQYANSIASPFTFADGNDTLYYIGEQDGVYIFSELLPLNEDFGGGTSVTTYMVTWNNYDGSELMHEFYPEGETPEFKGSEPEKPTDDDNTYTFIGWKKAGDDTLYSDTLENFPAVTEAVTYTAQYTANPRQKYTVTWKNYDGEPLDTEEYLEDAMPTYKGADPVKADDAQSYYDFSGWSPTVQKVKGDAEYTAQYTPVTKYTITWINWDEEVLLIQYYRDGAQNPTYPNTDPTRPSDEEYSYSFSGWAPAVQSVVEKSETYTAQYVRTPLVGPDPPVVENSGVLPTDDEKIYEVIGKWYLDKDSDLRCFDENGAFEEYGTTLYLGNAPVAAIDANKTLAHTVYVTGTGAENDPYIFHTNYLYGNANATNINGNGTVFPMTDVYPGDGFYGCARINVGSGTLVTFMADPTVCQATSGGYVGVGKNDYGYAYNGANAAVYKTHGPYDFETGKHTLYYLGQNDDDAYVFTIEPLAAHPDFSAEFTVTWLNWNEQLLYREKYARNADPVYKGDTPEKAEDEENTYSFDGWNPHLMPVTRDIVYTAKFKTYPKTPSDPIEDIAWIFPTDGVLEYDLEHMYYLYDGEKHLFPGKGFIKEDGSGHITVCDLIVADIVEYNDEDTISEFVHTVFVSGTGSYYDPFVFHPNYLYHGPKSIISNGASIAIGEENIFATSTYIVGYPGDCFKAMTRMRVGRTPVRFLPDESYHESQIRFIGVGETTYGYEYDREVASPYTFSSANGVLYYHGEDDYGYVFAEYPAEYQQSFGDPETYTVTWKNYNGDILETDTCYYDDTPSFDKDDPEKPAYSRFTYTFSGWDDGTNVYGTDDVLPNVTGDVTYTAVFTETSKLFTGHSLTLKGDIGINFFLDVTEDEINTGDGVVVKFSWVVEGVTKTSESKLNTANYIEHKGKTYYKASCWVAAAEMTYTVHADAYINGVLEEETDEYTVGDYGMEIINAPEGTYENQDALVDLVEAMLDYGAKAQVLFNRRKNDLANKDVTSYTMTEITAETIPAKLSDMEDGVDAYGLEYYGTSIIFLTQTTLRHYYKRTGGAVSAEVKAAALASGFEYGERQGYVYFEKKNIGAADLDTVQQISFDGETCYDFSVLDYSRQVLMSSMTQADKELAMATYWYNYYANIYLGH